MGRLGLAAAALLAVGAAGYASEAQAQARAKEILRSMSVQEAAAMLTARAPAVPNGLASADSWTPSRTNTDTRFASTAAGVYQMHANTERQTVGLTFVPFAHDRTVEQRNLSRADLQGWGMYSITPPEREARVVVAQKEAGGPPTQSAAWGDMAQEAARHAAVTPAASFGSVGSAKGDLSARWDAVGAGYGVLDGMANSRRASAVGLERFVSPDAQVAGHGPLGDEAKSAYAKIREAIASGSQPRVEEALGALKR